MATLEDAAEHYRQTFKLEPPDLAEVPDDKKEEAANLLMEAANSDKPFESDVDFREALGLPPSP